MLSPMNPLQAWRKKTGMTTREVSVKLDVSQITVNGWERGVSHPRPQYISALAELMGIKVGTLAARWAEWWEETQAVHRGT